MSSTGAIFPQSGATAGVGDHVDFPFANPTNIFADDATVAAVTSNSFDTGTQTEVLKAYNFNFSSIPDGATILGVTCVVNCYYTDGGVSADLMQLLNTLNNPVGTNQCSTPVALETSVTGTVVKGSSSDLWGNELTAAWVKNSNFGVGIGFISTGLNSEVRVDFVTLTIEYTSVTGSTYNDAFSIAKQLSTAKSVLATVAGSVSLPKIDSISESVLGTYEINIPLSKQDSISLGNIATLPDSIFLIKDLELLDVAGLNIQDTFSLGKQLAFPEVVITLYSITGGYAFGEQNPTQGETAVSWQTWSNGSGGVPTISGDANWGKLMLDESGQEARSAVYDLGSTGSRTFTLFENRYGTGNTTPVLSIRGDSSVFLQDDILPTWEVYSTSISRSWRYVQVRESTIL